MIRILMNRWFKRFAAKDRIGSQALIEASERASRSLIDTDLGGGVIRQRVARPGHGRSGGYRTLNLFRVGNRAVFAFGFAKSDQVDQRCGYCPLCSEVTWQRSHKCRLCATPRRSQGASVDGVAKSAPRRSASMHQRRYDRADGRPVITVEFCSAAKVSAPRRISGQLSCICT